MTNAPTEDTVTALMGIGAVIFIAIAAVSILAVLVIEVAL